MNKRIMGVSAALLVNTAIVFSANATVVSGFAATEGPLGTWYESDTRENGTASVVDLSGESGNLKNNVPLGTGAAKLTTGLSNDDKAQVTVNGNFGTIDDFINGNGSLSYEYLKKTVPGGDPSPAASIKLDVFDFNTTFTDPEKQGGTFVFEPYQNPAGDPQENVWTSKTLTGDSGTVWSTGIYNQGNQAGATGMTLKDWLDNFFGPDFLDAVIIGISVGVGSYNQGQEAYFDNIQFSSKDGDITANFDFELAPSAVPVPAALPLFGTGIALLGFMGWRRKRQQA